MNGHGGLEIIPPGGLINQLRAKMTLFPQEQFKVRSCSRIIG